MTEQPGKPSVVSRVLSYRNISWLLVVVVTAVVSVVLALIGLPSPVLFGSLVGGMVCALTRREELTLPKATMTVGQGVIGVVIGAMVDLATIRALGGDWAVILGVLVATLVVSVLLGQALRLHRGVSGVTSAFAFIAGGASGIVALARDLGSDERVVTVIQYLRVLLILLAMPVITTVVFRPGQVEHGQAPQAAHSPWWVGTLFVLLCLPTGYALGRLTRLPSASLLGPLLVAVALSITGWFGPVEVPEVLQNLGYALIGVQIGLRFTRRSLLSIAKMLPLAVLLILAIIAACAGLGVLLAQVTGVSQLDAYLATTPGGLYAVLATAAESGSNVTFVLAVQVLRVFVMLLLAPLLARLFRASRAREPADTGG